MPYPYCKNIQLLKIKGKLILLNLKLGQTFKNRSHEGKN
jgi:hypothetical protein